MHRLSALMRRRMQEIGGGVGGTVGTGSSVEGGGSGIDNVSPKLSGSLICSGCWGGLPHWWRTCTSLRMEFGSYDCCGVLGSWWSGGYILGTRRRAGMARQRLRISTPTSTCNRTCIYISIPRPRRRRRPRTACASLCASPGQPRGAARRRRCNTSAPSWRRCKRRRVAAAARSAVGERVEGLAATATATATPLRCVEQQPQQTATAAAARAPYYVVRRLLCPGEEGASGRH